MPADENIMKQTEIQKIKHRYQDVNKNEVKFRGKNRRTLNMRITNRKNKY